MNKELTPLEVSKQLKEFVLEYTKNGLDRRFVIGSFDIIENALKALEIIKEKRVNVFALKTTNTLKEYNNVFIGNYCDRKTRKLKREEYELLKEVLK